MGAICSWYIWAMNLLKQHKLYLVKHIISCPYSTFKCYSKFSFLETPAKLMSRIFWSDFKTAISEKLHNSLDFSCFLGLMLTKWWWSRQLLKTHFQREPLRDRRIHFTWSKTFLAARSDSEPYTWDWETESTLCMDDERPRDSTILLRLVDDPDSFSVPGIERSLFHLWTTTTLLPVTQKLLPEMLKVNMTPPSYSGRSMILTASTYVGLKCHSSVCKLQSHHHFQYQSLKSCGLNCLKLKWEPEGFPPNVSRKQSNTWMKVQLSPQHKDS